MKTKETKCRNGICKDGKCKCTSYAVAAIIIAVALISAPRAHAAIAFVASSSVIGVDSTTVTLSTTAAGSNLLALACFGVQPNDLPSPTATAFTYGGQTMSYLGQVENGAAQAWQGMYGLLNAPAGTQNFVGTFASSSFTDVVISVFSGVGSIDTTNTAQRNSVSTIAPTTTVNGANEWLWGCAGNSGGSAMTAGAGTTVRVSAHSTTGDSNGTVSTGLQSLTFNDSSHNYMAVIVAFAPVVAASTPPLQMKFTQFFGD